MLQPKLHSVSSTFFYGYAAHRNLHSFPTRRSSELVVVRAYRALLAATATVTGEQTAGQRAPRDRKSTRLNSSHVSISYAVFCLKKKISTQSLSYFYCI